MKLKITIALLALVAVSNVRAATALPASLPEFMNKERLVKWRADKELATTSASIPVPEASSQFFTGKPFMAEAGGYIFKYRTYNPETSRWTSADPSGFPDGPNACVYAPVPTTGIDRLGLYNSFEADIDIAAVDTVIGGWTVSGFNYSAEFASLSLNKAGNRTAGSGEDDDLKGATAFTDVFNQGFFNNLAKTMTTYNSSGLVDYGFPGTDLGDSYGRVSFGYSGTISWNNGHWSTTATFTFADTYDFDATSHVPFVVSMSRLQTNGYATAFTSSGTFTVSYSE